MGAPQYEQAGADIGGTGTTNTIPRWTGPSTLGDSGLIDNGTAIYTTTRNVGIGTASPLGPLDVRDATVSGLGVTSIYTGAITANQGGALTFGGYFTGTSPTTWAKIVGGKDNATAGEFGGHLQFLTRPNGGSLAERARIDSAGNFGIGTSGPWSKISAVTANGADTVSVGFSFDSANNYRSGISTNWSSVAASQNLMGFLVSNATPTGFTRVMTLNGAGQAAIGTTSFTTGRALTTVADLDVFGVRVGRGGDGSQTSNTALGRSVLGAITTGDSCTGVGALALQSATGSRNTGLGYASLAQLSSGVDNSALGSSAAGNNTGSRNTAIGSRALQGVVGTSTGSDNVCIGERAGDSITTGASNIVIGSNADVAAAGDSNQFVLGDATNYVATNGGATTYYATAGASLGYMRVRLNGTYVKIEVFADV